MFDILGDGAVADDGAGNQLGEEGDVQPHKGRILLHRYGAPVYIHHIAQGLKGEEGNADGQTEVRLRDNPCQRREPVQQCARDKIHVLEHEQDR